MKPNQLTFTKSQAIAYSTLNKRLTRYMYQFDVDVVFRKGKLDDEQMGKVRYKEDSRPLKVLNSRTKRLEDKKNDIVTYKTPDKDGLFVLAKSGGISLFDGISSKVSLRNKDCWWIVTKDARLDEGLVIAKDIFKDAEGNTHYSIEPDRDMLLSEYLEKLEKLKKYMKRV